MSKHTKGQWVVGHSFHTGVERFKFGISVGKMAVAEVWDDIQYGEQSRNGKANAARIVACVNACEGIEDPGVVQKMKRLLLELETVRNSSRHEFRIADLGFASSDPEETGRALGYLESVDFIMGRISAILARAEGGKT